MVEHAGKTGRAWRIVLVLSLALNMAVVGVVAGFALRGDKGGGPQRFDLSFGPIGAALSRDDRRAIARGLRERTDLRPPRRGEMPPVIADLVAALRSDPVDEAALRAAAHAPAVRMMVLQETAAALLAERVIAMTPAERAAFADRIVEKANRRGRDG